MASATDNLITVVAGSSNLSRSGLINVTLNTGAFYTIEFVWHYSLPGSISSISPGSGQYGTHVAISGHGLLGGGSSIQRARLAGVDVYSVISFSDSLVVVEANVGSAGHGSVEVESDTGAIISLIDTCP